jgi:hypothetical protein
MSKWRTTYRSANRSPRTRGGATASDAGAPLSKLQKAKLAQVAKEAFDYQEALGLVETVGTSASARFTEWRREEQHKAVGHSSLTTCGNNHYRSLLGHFLTLAGKDDKAYGYHVRTGRVKDHGELDDTHENRETQRKLIMDKLLAHGHRCDPRHASYDAEIAAKVEASGGLITAHYIIAIAKRKHRGRALDSLTADELKKLHWTTKNRIDDREGRGNAANRNKSQRKGGKRA